MRRLAQPAAALLCIILQLTQPEHARGSLHLKSDEQTEYPFYDDVNEIQEDCFGEICPLFPPTDEQLPADVEVNVKEILNFLDEGEQHINHNAPNNSILIMGLTGTGKSTFTQYIAGNNDNLMSEENDAGQYIIKDVINNKISHASTILSKTVYPDLIVDEKRNVGFYDCPGFSDTRSVTNDISSTYFIKNIIEMSGSIKLIFTVSEHQVVADQDRSGFMQLLEHATTMLNNIDKFDNSIGLVVTKVTNYNVRNSKLKWRTDIDVIQTTASFLNGVKRDLLVQRKKRGKLMFHDPIFYKKAITLIDIFLSKDEKNNYSKIGIFRRPNESGKISQIVLLQDGKHMLEHMIHTTLKFTKQNVNEDFDYTISSDSKLYVNDIKQALIKKIENVFVNEARTKMEELSSYSISEINLIIQDYLDKGEINENKYDAKKISEKFKLLKNTLNDLTNNLQIITNPENAIDEINYVLQILEINIIDDTRGLKKQLRFLDSVSNKNTTCNWENNFNDILKNLFYVDAHLTSDFARIQETIIHKIQDNYKNACEDSKLFYEENFSHYEIGKFQQGMNEARKELFIKWELLHNGVELSYVDILKFIQNLGITEIDKYVFENKKLETHRRYFNLYNDSKITDFIITDLRPFESLCQFVVESLQWCNILDKVFDYLSAYNIQKERNKYVASIPNLAEQKNIHNFIQSIFPNNEDLAKNITITNLMKNALNYILESTLRKDVMSFCNESHELTLKGDFIKFSDFIDVHGNIKFGENCKEIKTVNIFALNNVFLDMNLVNDKQIQIFIASPKWEVIEHRTINLDGKNGDEMKPPKAQTHTRFGQDGEDGYIGFAGGPGGRLCGVADEIANSENLYITANGGKGGSGQDGGDGAPASLQKSEETIDFSNILGGFLYKNDRVVKTSGGSGGDGGRGGHGGLGGPAGNVTLLVFGNTSNANVKQSNGFGGNDGKGGKGGNAADTVFVRLVDKCILWAFCWSDDPEERVTRYRSGHNGGVGWFQQMFLPIDEAVEENKCLTPQDVEKYRNAFDNILTHSLNPKPYIEFVNRLTQLQNNMTTST